MGTLMIRVLFVSLIVATVAAGCGKSREEQYAEAVQVLDADTRHLDALTGERDRLNKDMELETMTVEEQSARNLESLAETLSGGRKEDMPAELERAKHEAERSAVLTQDQVEQIRAIYKPRLDSLNARIEEQAQRVERAKATRDSLAPAR